jgi:parvulin-like peptidyl-prolyl isomerase
MDELQIQFARKKGVEPTEAQVDVMVKQAKLRPDFAQNLAAQNLSLNDFRQQVRVHLARANVLTQGISVTDADALADYQRNVDPANPAAKFFTPDTISVQVIVSPIQEDLLSAKSYLADNEPFEQVAHTCSKDPSGKFGGYIAPIARGRTSIAKIPGMEDAFFKLKVGQVLGPVKYNGEWWMVKCLDKTPGSTMSYDQARDQCVEDVRVAKGQIVNGARIKQEFIDFKDASRLQPFAPFYAPTLDGL